MKACYTGNSVILNKLHYYLPNLHIGLTSQLHTYGLRVNDIGQPDWPNFSCIKYGFLKCGFSSPEDSEGSYLTLTNKLSFV